MTKTYTATGINLKAIPLGEHDRLLTILTREYGLVRAVAPGVRKYRSKLAGRAELFVVNSLMIAQGKSLDRVTQAETQQSFLKLGKNLAKLTAAQYLAELTLKQALSEHPQEELFCVLVTHLERLQSAETLPMILPALVHGAYHLLAIAGYAPQLHRCCVSQEPIVANLTDRNPVKFSVAGGGMVAAGIKHHPPISHYLKPQELLALQLLPQVSFSLQETQLSVDSWLVLERVLRAYAHYHLDLPIQSAALIDSCFCL